MIRFGYLQPLDKSLLPNLTANAQDLLKNPWYDPGNIYSVAWQAGIVGIGYNPKLTGREITSFDDLLDPAFKGHSGHVQRDDRHDEPDAAEHWREARGRHDRRRQAGPAEAARPRPRPASSAASTATTTTTRWPAETSPLTMAWSGDISQMQLYDNPDVKFVIPRTGGMLFVDNMVIPK